MVLVLMDVLWIALTALDLANISLKLAEAGTFALSFFCFYSAGFLRCRGFLGFCESF